MTTDEQERIRNCAKCKNFGRDFCDHKQCPHLTTMRWAIVCSRYTKGEQSC